jgi:pimeloyl-ACP methyl ester carboxylesterase
VAVSDELGERRTVEVPAGTIEYRERGSGPAVVFAHGVAVNGDLWRKVAPDLAGAQRCIAPDLPLGGHSLPLRGEPDLSLYGLAGILADFIEALDLSDVTLVANDTGGAISQALVGSRPERIGRLVLTSCDAFDNFPPKAVAYLKPTARVRPAFWLLAQSMRFRRLQRLPIAYGWPPTGRSSRASCAHTSPRCARIGVCAVTSPASCGPRTRVTPNAPRKACAASAGRRS